MITSINEFRKFINENSEREYNPDEDLFLKDFDDLPEIIKPIISKYSEIDGLTYEDCANLVKELNAVGYTCDYYLDAEPYDLRKMTDEEIAEYQQQQQNPNN